MNKNFIIVGILLFLLMSCNTSEEVVMQELKKGPFSSIETNPGSQDVTIDMPNGNTYSFKVTFPEDQSEPMPLVLGLHWAGALGTYREYHDCLLAPSFENTNAILISPEGNADLWISELSEAKVIEIVNAAIRSWDIDMTSVVVTGYSNGGNGTWFYAENYPNMFAVAIPMAASYEPKEKIDIPMLVIHGELDDLFPLARIQTHVAAARQDGTAITLDIVPGLSHFQACSYVPALKKGVEWAALRLNW